MNTVSLVGLTFKKSPTSAIPRRKLPCRRRRKSRQWFFLVYGVDWLCWVNWALGYAPSFFDIVRKRKFLSICLAVWG